MFFSSLVSENRFIIHSALLYLLTIGVFCGILPRVLTEENRAKRCRKCRVNKRSEIERAFCMKLAKCELFRNAGSEST